jgi:site-specific DNA-methyltransferase (adenine-specific)
MLIARPAFRTNTRSVDDVWRIPFESGSEHPAPFPLKLATRAISSTNAALVLDPFMGSGTTLRAAKDLGRKAIGIELEERYCEIAAKRLGQEVLAL